ncbi:MAG: methyl-accepting chemotaxis protein [bacterium]|nr:methyl-accepting chemotaxis protein [bacterium]
MRKKLSVKVLFLSTIVILLLNSIIALVYGKALRDSNLEQLAISNRHSLEIVLAAIDQEDLKSVLEEQSMESAAFKGINSTLQRIQNDDTMTYLYIESYSEDGKQCYYLIDALDPEDENFYALGTEDKMNSYQELLGGETLVSDIYEIDKNEHYMTVEIPILDENNKLIASIGTDIRVDDILKLVTKSIAVMVIILLIISSLELALLYYGLKKMIINPVKKLHEVVKATTKLDFTEVGNEGADCVSQDEIGEMVELIYEMRKSLKEGVITMSSIGMQVSKVSELLFDTAEQSMQDSKVIFDGVEDLNNGVEKQMLETQKSGEAFARLNSQLDLIIGNLEKMNELTTSTKDRNTECSKSIDRLDETFKFNEEITNNVNCNMEVLIAQSKAIEQIVDVISDITKKTNLLSLNASIEAARAGQAGKGFVVVAEEIKGLADDTQASAVEIKKMIEGLIHDIQHMSQGVNQLVDSTDSLKEVSNTIGGAFKQTENGMFEMFELLEQTNQEVQIVMGLKDRSSESIDYIKQEAKEYQLITKNMEQSVKEEIEIVKQINDISRTLKEKSDELLVITKEYKL